MSDNRESSKSRAWPIVRLGDVADVQLGKMLDAKRTAGTPLPYLRNVNVRWGYIDTTDLVEMPFQDHELERYAVVEGDVLVCEGGEPGRAAVWKTSDLTVKYQKALHRVRLKGGILPSWLVNHLFLDAKSGRLGGHFTGSTIGHFTRESLLEYRIPVAPIAEQHRIIEAVESYSTRLDDAVATLERVQRNLKRYRASVLKAAVEGRLVPTEAELARAEKRDYEPASELLKRILVERRRRWEEAELAKMKASGKTPKDDKWKAKYEEPAPPVSIGLPRLPEGWVWATVLQLCGTVTDGDHLPPPQTDTGVPFLVIGNLRDGSIDLSDTRFVPKQYYATLDDSRRPRAGDILYTVTGSFGIPVLVRTDQGFCVQRHIAILRPLSCINAPFISRVLETPLVFRQATSIATGTAQKTVPLKGLRQIVLPLPPQQEQERILLALERHLSLVQEDQQVLDTAILHCARLRQSILKWAFEGKLVDQDPNDEPASVLLDRIRAERAATSQKNSSAKKPRRTSRNA